MTVGDRVKLIDRAGDVPEGAVGKVGGLYRRDDLLVLVVLPGDRTLTVPATALSLLQGGGGSSGAQTKSR